MNKKPILSADATFVDEVLGDLELIAYVVPDYSFGRIRGLTEAEVEVRAHKALVEAISMLRFYVESDND